MPSCKGYITLVDSLLLPFDPATPPQNDFAAAAAMLGAQGCAVQPNSQIVGQEIKAGDANRQVGPCLVAGLCWTEP